MKRYIASLGLLICIGWSAEVYADRVTSALKKLRKNHLEDARTYLDKALRKNPENAGARYVYALYFLYQYAPAPSQSIASLNTEGLSTGPGHITGNSEAYLDSAYACIRAAAASFPQTDRGALRRWQKAGITLSSIQTTQAEIDSLAFVLAQIKNSVNGYQSFLDRFPEALQKPQALEKRNELAYAEAARINTYKSYKKFLDTYPDARQAREAEKLYELLLFEFLTQEDNLNSYEKFLEVQPKSPYRDEAERRIYELATLSHTRQSYYNFIKRFSNNPYVTQAWYWIYSLYRQEDNPAADFLKVYPDFFDKAYIQKRIETEPLAYFPLYSEETGKFGFIDANGRLQVETRYDSVHTDYFCDGIKENTMLVYRKSQLGAVDKTGLEITGFGYDNIESLEGELLKVEKNQRVGVWHKAGFAVLPVQYEAVEEFNETFLLVKQNGKYGLSNFFGGKITEAEFDEIKNLEEGLIAFRQHNRYALIPGAALLEKKFPELQFLYDGVEWVRQDALKVKIGAYEGVLNASLETVITPVQAQLKPLAVGWMAQYEKYQQLLDTRGRLLADSLDAVTSNDAFYAVRRGDQWAVWKTSITPRLKFDYDMVMLLGQDGFAVKKGSVSYAFFAPDIFLKLGSFVKISLLQSEEQPTRRWILVEDKSGNQGLLSLKGQQILPARYTKISLLTPDLIAVQTGKKSGLVDGTGKQILPMLYTALNYENGFVSTLKNGKFGLLHLSRGIDIPPQYERIIRPYTENSLLFLATKNGKYGFITADNQPVSEFVFDEVRYWQYGVALVRQNDAWHLYHIAEKKFIFKPIEDYRYIRNDDKEVIVRIYANRQYGVMSNVRGVVIDFEYDDLRNVGTEEIPFYLAEKHVTTGDVYLIFYIDRHGKKVQKQLFDQKRYERIICE